MPGYLSNDASIAKGVERKIREDADTFWSVVVGVHDDVVVRFNEFTLEIMANFLPLMTSAKRPASAVIIR